MNTRIFPWMFVLLASFIGLAGCRTNHQTEGHEAHATYFCPMHPEVTSDKPGICPICHMDLVKKASDEGLDMTAMSGALRLSETKQILANVSTFTVERRSLAKTVNAYSYIDFAEPSRKLITARFNGRIERLWVDKTGDVVYKGQPLFEVYSPDLVQAQNDFLVAVGNDVKIIKTSINESAGSLVESAKKKLELMGITEQQIRELDSTRTVRYTMTYHSPYDGIVISKNVQDGMYFTEGTNLFETADLSVLWVISEIYEQDLDIVTTGQPISFRADAFSGEEFHGRVTYIYPTVGAESRTVKVRSEFLNRGGKLRPQMYGRATFEKTRGQALAVPENAVLFTGIRQIVWVKSDSLQFEPREIKVGVKDNGFYEVLSGLKEGEKIAATGGFLVDSESQLQTGRTTEKQHNH